MEDLNPTKREEEFLRGIKLAAAGEESSVPTPVWDYEKRLYDIWLAAKGEDPIYNLPIRTPHPDAFYAGILDALASGGGGVVPSFDGAVTVTIRNIPAEMVVIINGMKINEDGSVTWGTLYEFRYSTGGSISIPAPRNNTVPLEIILKKDGSYYLYRTGGGQVLDYTGITPSGYRSYYVSARVDMVNPDFTIAT